jgi:hypothetical protein
MEEKIRYGKDTKGDSTNEESMEYISIIVDDIANKTAREAAEALPIIGLRRVKDRPKISSMEKVEMRFELGKKRCNYVSAVSEGVSINLTKDEPTRVLEYPVAENLRPPLTRASTSAGVTIVDDEVIDVDNLKKKVSGVRKNINRHNYKVKK